MVPLPPRSRFVFRKRRRIFAMINFLFLDDGSGNFSAVHGSGAFSPVTDVSAFKCCVHSCFLLIADVPEALREHCVFFFVNASHLKKKYLKENRTRFFWGECAHLCIFFLSFCYNSKKPEYKEIAQQKQITHAQKKCCDGIHLRLRWNDQRK